MALLGVPVLVADGLGKRAALGLVPGGRGVRRPPCKVVDVANALRHVVVEHRQQVPLPLKWQQLHHHCTRWQEHRVREHRRLSSDDDGRRRKRLKLFGERHLLVHDDLTRLEPVARRHGLQRREQLDGVGNAWCVFPALVRDERQRVERCGAAVGARHRLRERVRVGAEDLSNAGVLKRGHKGAIDVTIASVVAPQVAVLMAAEADRIPWVRVPVLWHQQVFKHDPAHLVRLCQPVVVDAAGLRMVCPMRRV
mmetsp:Transcript_23746/g.70481  ORF Transcript_23746/g.70481 Transcript_23746/m.70481 type:complete len:252 (+) Transcript_23746:523-1278(+)